MLLASLKGGFFLFFIFIYILWRQHFTDRAKRRFPPCELCDSLSMGQCSLGNGTEVSRLLVDHRHSKIPNAAKVVLATSIAGLAQTPTSHPQPSWTVLLPLFRNKKKGDLFCPTLPFFFSFREDVNGDVMAVADCHGTLVLLYL